MGVKLQLDDGNPEIKRPPAIIEFEPEKHECPWGYFQVLYEDTHCKVKKLVVKPGQRTSLQRHLHRQEHWTVVVGTVIGVKMHGYGTRSKRLLTAGLSGSGLVVYPLDWHRLQNETNADAVIIETQTGSYFGEDDIERKEDDYGRASAG